MLTAISGLYLLGIVGFIVGLVVALIIIFKQSTNPALVLTYSVAEGMALGALTGALESSSNQYAGIGFQAILGVVGVFIGMLVVYKTGAIRVTPRLTKMVIGAAIGVIVLMLANLVVSFFTARRPGPALGRPAGDHLQPGLHRDRRVHAAARLRPGRPGREGGCARRGSPGTWPSGS